MSCSRCEQYWSCPASASRPRAGNAAIRGALAVELLARLDDLGVGSAVLVGHSASCHIVVEAAVRAPDRVSGLVQVGPTAPAGVEYPVLVVRVARVVAVTLPAGAHMVVLTHPDRLAEHVDAFLDRCAASPTVPSGAPTVTVSEVSGSHDLMTVTSTPIGRGTVVEVVGELDLRTSPDLMAAIDEAVRGSGVRVVVVDLSRVDFLGSSGLGVLAGLATRATASDRPAIALRIVAPADHRPVTKPWEAMNLQQILPLHPTVAAALAAD